MTQETIDECPRCKKRLGGGIIPAGMRAAVRFICDECRAEFELREVQDAYTPFRRKAGWFPTEIVPKKR